MQEQQPSIFPLRCTKLLTEAFKSMSEESLSFQKCGSQDMVTKNISPAGPHFVMEG